MAEDQGGKKRGFGRKLLDVFVRDVGSSESEPDTPEAATAPEYETIALDAITSVAPAPSTANGADHGIAQPGSQALAAVDFAALYAKTITDGDPSFDTVLEVFRETATLDGRARQTSIAAILKAMRADPGSISATAGKRMQIVALVLEKEEERMIQLECTVLEDRIAFEESQQARIAALEQEIATHHRAITERNGAVEAQLKAEKGKFHALRECARAEELALGQLKQFLQPTEAPRQKREEKE